MRTRTAAAVLALLTLAASLVGQKLELPIGQRLAWFLFAILAIAICVVSLFTQGLSGAGAPRQVAQNPQAQSLRKMSAGLRRLQPARQHNQPSLARMILVELVRFPIGVLRLLVVVLSELIEWWRDHDADEQSRIVRIVVTLGYLAAGALLILPFVVPIIWPDQRAKSGWNLSDTVDWQLPSQYPGDPGGSYEAKIETHGRTGKVVISAYTSSSSNGGAEDLELRSVHGCGYDGDRWAYVGNGFLFMVKTHLIGGAGFDTVVMNDTCFKLKSID